MSFIALHILGFIRKEVFVLNINRVEYLRDYSLSFDLND